MNYKFRKKPIIIEAFQFIPLTTDTKDWPEWLNKAWNTPIGEKGSFYMGNGRFYISTLEGKHEVSMNDWIIQGIKGELYPCKPDIFNATYEEVL